MALVVPSSVVGGAPQNVTELLKINHVIPSYQRDYVWEGGTVRQLWEDLTGHYQRFAVAEQLPDPDGYFLGAMVVIEPQGSGSPEVVDGQQRLTTLSTVVSVLFDALQELPASDQSRVGYEARMREMLGKFDVTWVANLSFPDQDLQNFFLKSCLLQRGHAEKTQYWSSDWCVERLKKKRSPIARLRNAIEVGYEFLDRFLDAQPDPALRLEKLISFVRLVTEGVVVLRITAKSHNNAYSIFESLNNRGVQLSQADLIKNELLRVAQSTDRADIIENWNAIRQTVDAFASVRLPDLLHYSYLSRYGRAKATELYVKAKDQLGAGPLASANAKRYSDELVYDSEALDALSESMKVDWTEDTINMLKDIKNVLGIKLCYPFLIAAFRRRGNVPAAFEKDVRAAMNFTFRYMKVLGGSVEGLAKTMSEASQLVNSSRPLSEVLDLFRKEAPDARFIDEFSTVSFQNTKLAYFAVYYLEKAQTLGSLPVQHGVGQNLEHIMPKSPTVADWPNANALKQSDPEQFEYNLWRIGNLLPLPAAINKSLKNRGIGHKISNASDKHYNAPNLGLSSPKLVPKFLTGTQWTIESIEAFQLHLAKNFALKAWAL